MRAGKRLWRTENGDLVEDGHPDAITLAYGEDDEAPDGETLRTSSRASSHTPKPEPKTGKATPKKTAAPTPKPGD